jgi:ubiquinone/menaquinone biosynthesis C-methylase UbiE
MNRSRSFDRAASYYDQTRPLPESIAGPGMRAILDITGPNARVLDAGTGTGRIGIPLLQQGLDLIGCDLSSSMLRRLREKFPPARIAQADATRLPFPGAGFNIVLTTHVLHLVPDWLEALREFRRVLAPGGAYLNITTSGSTGNSFREKLRLHWRNWLRAQGLNADNPGMQSREQLASELRLLGANITEVEVVRYSRVFTLRAELDRFATRTYSDSWEIPDASFESSIEELRTWADSEYGELDEQRQDEVRFSIDLARFDR